MTTTLEKVEAYLKSATREQLATFAQFILEDIYGVRDENGNVSHLDSEVMNPLALNDVLTSLWSVDLTVEQIEQAEFEEPAAKREERTER